MRETMFSTPETQRERYELVSPALTATTRWIEDILKSSMKPITEFRRGLASGEILCRLLNAISPGTIKRINHCPNRAAAADNLTLFLSACEETFGLQRSILFSVNDFDDVFERGNERAYSEIPGIKHTEKVVITLFWLAKAIEKNPNCQSIPRLDYNAFFNLLPKPVTHPTPICVTGDNEQNRSRTQNFVERKSSYIGEKTIQPHRFIRPQPSNNMGNTQLQLPSELKQPSQTVSLIQNMEAPPPQANNNALDEDGWQSYLEDWCERRRTTSLKQATNMYTLEEQRREEESRRKAEIRARLQAIKTQRTSVTSSYIPSTDISQPPPASSPGMALLTGSAFDFSELNDDSVLSSIAPYRMLNKTNEAAPLDHPPVPLTNGDVVDRKNEPKTNGDPKDRQINVTSDISHPVHAEPPKTTICPSDVQSQDLKNNRPARDFRSVSIRLQSKTGVREPRWGMTIKANGPNSSAPFVVERVKIGSSADICDVNQGDILVQMNGMDLRESSANAPLTLQSLEQLMDQLTLSGKSANLTVLRKTDQEDEFSDDDEVERSDTEEVTFGAPSGDRELDTASPSGLDDTIVPGTTVPVNKTPVDEIDSSNQYSIRLDPPLASPKPLAVDSVQEMNTRDPSPIRAISSPPRPACPEGSPQTQRNDVSPDNSDHWSQPFKTSTSPPTQLLPNIRSSSNAQMIDVAETGASQLNTPSQVDESIQSKHGMAPSGRHVEVTDTEPTYMSLAVTVQSEEITQKDYQLTQPPLSRQDAQSTVLPKSQSPIIKIYPNNVPQLVDSESVSVPQSPSSPLPPPPPLPLSITPPPAEAEQLPDLLKLEFHPITHFIDSDPPVYQTVSDSEPEPMPSPKPDTVITRSSDLPSPPPPQFFSPDTTPFALNNLAYPTDSNGHTNGYYPKEVHISERDRSKSMLGYSMYRNDVPIRVDLSSRPSLDIYGGSQTLRNTTPLTVLPTTPPPAPSSPLLPPLSNHRIQNSPTKAIPVSESAELVIDHFEDSKEPTVYKRHEMVFNLPPHTRLFAPPPPPMANRSDPPPQPPRVPTNKHINQTQKCIACTQELGSGDLMFIESMSLYYHLACFVCSRCGVALNDGLSNTDVRIRGGQLYCNDCYPSRHTKSVQQSGGSHRSHNSMNRSDVPLSCYDRRSRPRGHHGEPRGSSTVSGPYSRYAR